MFDIEKYLDSIRISDVRPTEELVRRTKQRCEETEARDKKRGVIIGRIRKAALIALPAAAVLAIGIFIGARFFSVQSTQPEPVAYYTVDINPSLCVSVDKNGAVTGLAGQNDDAGALLGSLDCMGKPVGEAIRQIISAAQAAGYLSGGQHYVLIGCFGADGTTAQSALDGLQAQLEADFGDMIDLLIVSGTLDDKQTADALRVSAGLLKLSQLAEGVEVSDEDKVEDILGEVAQINQTNYCAPALSVGGDAQSLKFKWDELDFDAIGYTGKVRYHIAAADTGAEITAQTARTLGTVSFYTYDAQTTSLKLKLQDCSLQPGDSQYFGIYAEYGGVVVSSEAVYYTVPEAEPAETPSPTPTAEPEPEPAETPAPPASHTVSGRVSGDKVILTWDKDTSASLAGYKVVASRTNPNPRYPDDGYLKFITNAGTTSISLYEGYSGLQGGAYYYFSVTYLYQDGSTVAGNAVKLKVPDKDDEEEEPDPPPASDHAASTISGRIEGTTVHLSWSAIDAPDFDGYKVVYSFSDSTPRYPDNGYYNYITDPGDTSRTIDATGLNGYAAGAPCWFSITVLYTDGDKVPGNVLKLMMPEGEPAKDYAASHISGSIEGTTVHLSWSEIDDDRFDGYKVVYSFSDSTPKYPDNGYYVYITDAGDTGRDIEITGLNGYSPGATCYFSITVLYNGGGVKVAGDVYSVTAP